MKKIILLPLVLLVGCASLRDIVNPNVVDAPYEIMKDCEEYVKLKDGTTAEMLKVITENKKVYVNCVSQNKAKKEFILRQSK